MFSLHMQTQKFVPEMGVLIFQLWNSYAIWYQNATVLQNTFLSFLGFFQIHYDVK